MAEAFADRSPSLEHADPRRGAQTWAMPQQEQHQRQQHLSEQDTASNGMPAPVQYGESGLQYPGPYSAPATSLHFPPEQIAFGMRPTSPSTQAASLLAFRTEQQLPPIGHYFAHAALYQPFHSATLPTPHSYGSPMPNPMQGTHMYPIPEYGGLSHERRSARQNESPSVPEYDMRQLHLLSPAYSGNAPRDGNSPMGSEHSSYSTHDLRHRASFEQHARPHFSRDHRTNSQDSQMYSPSDYHTHTQNGVISSQYDDQYNDVSPFEPPSATRTHALPNNNYAALARDATFSRRSSANEGAEPPTSGMPGERDVSPEAELPTVGSPLTVDAANMLVNVGEQLMSPAVMESENFKPTAQGTPFISKLLHLLSNDKYRDYIRWNKSGDSFILSHTNQYFAAQVLPILFRHSNTASFIRQLNLYQFQRLPVMQLLQNLDEEGTGNLGTTAPSSCFSGFSHPHFKRGQEDTYHLIKPKASTKSRDRSGSAASKKAKLAGECGKNAPNTRNRSASSAQAGPAKPSKSAKQQNYGPHDEDPQLRSPRSTHFHPYYQPPVQDQYNGEQVSVELERYPFDAGMPAVPLPGTSTSSV